MSIELEKTHNWMSGRIKRSQITKYMTEGKDFIPHGQIFKQLAVAESPDFKRVKDILDKSLAIKTLSLIETATLLKVEDPKVLELMRQTALKVKKKVYDNRIVTFAPLYLGNHCVNDCLYCGFRCSNSEAKRRVLTQEEVRQEIKVLAGGIGHKRLIVVYGEHPSNDLNYMVDTINTIYQVREKTKKGVGQIRRVNVNAPPLSIEELKRLKATGIGTYQVFQETYHKSTYKAIHPPSTIKGNYFWRLYAMHRAFEAGIDDVGLGVLFGLYDWRFEVMSLVAHNRELEDKFGVGAHTISFPRLEPAGNTPFCENPKYKVSDDQFKRLVTVLRLAVPHTGLIITCRETPQMKRESIGLGITQTDASTKIGIGAYSDQSKAQEASRQQFILADIRSLDEMIREFAQDGYITSFCTAGYRCGRTGGCIMDLLKTGKESQFCKLNAVLTFQEWLDDFASEETKKMAEKVINKEMEQIRKLMPKVFQQFMEYYQRIKQGERDLYF